MAKTRENPLNRLTEMTDRAGEAKFVGDEDNGDDGDEGAPTASQQAEDKDKVNVDLEQGARQVAGVLEARPALALGVASTISLLSIAFFCLAMFANYGKSHRSVEKACPSPKLMCGSSTRRLALVRP